MSTFFFSITIPLQWMVVQCYCEQTMTFKIELIR